MRLYLLYRARLKWQAGCGFKHGASSSLTHGGRAGINQDSAAIRADACHKKNGTIWNKSNPLEYIKLWSKNIGASGMGTCRGHEGGEHPRNNLFPQISSASATSDNVLLFAWNKSYPLIERPEFRPDCWSSPSWKPILDSSSSP